MKPLHTADVSGHPVRFFRSPLPGEDLPWCAMNDLMKAMRLPRHLRHEHLTRLRAHWGSDIRSIVSDGKSVVIVPHWMAQGVTGALDNVVAGREAEDDAQGPLFLAYCKAAKEANDILLLMLGATPTEGVSRTIRAVMRGPGGGHVH